MTIAIKCRSCRKFRRATGTKNQERESTRMIAICHATHNTLMIVDARGDEIIRPTAQNVIFARIVPDENCPKVREARAKGLIQWADYSIDGNGTGKGWIEDVIF